MGQPGERFTDTNTGYTAVGVMIERVLDQDLATVSAWRRHSTERRSCISQLGGKSAACWEATFPAQ